LEQYQETVNDAHQQQPSTHHEEIIITLTVVAIA
jgi:hypothetical protein